MPHCHRQVSLGWKPDRPDKRDHKYGTVHRPATVTLPPAVDLRPAFAKKHLPVYDQGQLNSCVGNSVAIMDAFVLGLTPRSRLHIYYEARRLEGEQNTDDGAYIRDGVKVIATNGAGLETYWPYVEANVNVDPPEREDRDAAKRIVHTYTRLETRDDFRHCLAAGFPFVIGFTVYDNFMSDDVAAHGVVPMPDFKHESDQGGHAICVVGYDSDFHTSAWGANALHQGVKNVPTDVYIVRNSWSDQWGNGGHFAIDARYLEDTDLADDAWTVRKAAA